MNKTLTLDKCKANILMQFTMQPIAFNFADCIVVQTFFFFFLQNITFLLKMVLDIKIFFTAIVNPNFFHH